MSFVGYTTGYAQPGYYPPAPYQQAPGYAYGYPQQQAYGADAYRQGYTGGMQAVSPYTNQMTSAGNAMTDGANGVFGAINGVVGTVGNLLGGVVNAVTGLFGGGSPSPTYAQPGAYYPGAYQQAYYPQAYPQAYPQQGYPQMQSGYMPQQGQALYGNPHLQNVIPPPPERMNAQMGPQARLQAISGDLASMGNFTPMQGMSLVASHGEKAEQYRKQAESLLSRARSEMRSAVSMANTAARTGNPTKMAEAAGHRQAAFDTMRQAGELMGAVYDEAISAQITYNLLFGPYGRMRGADGNASMPLLQAARAQWEGGKEREGWFVPTIVPPYQRYLQAYQEIDRGMQQLAAAGIR
jgi:hypothetical protein